MAGLWRVINDVMAFSGPIFLNLIVSYLENETREPLWKGVAYAFGLLGCSLLQSLAQNQYFHIGFRVAMHVITENPNFFSLFH
jgi:hypothetical protein